MLACVEYKRSETFLNLALTQACLFYFVVHLNNHFSWRNTRHISCYNRYLRYVYIDVGVGLSLKVRISHGVVVAVEPSGYRAWLMDNQKASLCISPSINERRRHTIYLCTCTTIIILSENFSLAQPIPDVDFLRSRSENVSKKGWIV